MQRKTDSNDFAGKAGFIWWVGVVEDRQDPIKLGRCKVRCVGWHSENKMDLPTENLPWATPIMPLNNAHTYTPKEGDMVMGFFADGDNAQEPIMFGVFPGIPLKVANSQEAFSDPRTATELASAPKTPDSKEYNTDGSGIVITEKSQADSYPKFLDEPTTSRIARNDPESITETFIQERKDNLVTGIETVSDTWDEPETLYNTVYPYNNVVETESGHLLEFDDTPEAERIHLAHRNGSFQEWFPDGDKVEKVTKDNYQIVMGDDKVYIMGKCQVTIQGDAELYVQGNFDMNVDGTCNIRSTGNMKLNAPLIDLNDGTNGAARIGDTADTGDQGTGGHFDNNSAGTNVIETGSATVVIGG
jgi:uncharacterized Zn-binding protein involved in type VI secretion